MSKSKKVVRKSNAKKGDTFEKFIKETNRVYLNNNIAFIRKIPTPFKVIGFTPNRKLRTGFYEKRSSLDFNGVLKSGRHIAFDAKTTKSKTSFAFRSASNHQIDDMERLHNFNAYTFYLIKFDAYNEIYVLRFQDILDYLEINPHKKSIEYKYFKETLKDNLVSERYLNNEVIIDYLSVVYKLAKV